MLRPMIAGLVAMGYGGLATRFVQLGTGVVDVETNSLSVV
jgi:hypothetical protein